ncbi:peptidoglycan-binding protein [bacterium]|nr:peptidoglycan-binding protein [bacterium]
MPDHEVQQGECLSSIAHQHGIQDWRQLWEHPDNAELRTQRDPHILKPGDIVKIPDSTGPTFSGHSGERGDFRLTQAPPTELRLNLTDNFGEPYEQKEFRVEVGGETIDGRTDQNGQLRCQIPPDAETATVTLWYDSSTQHPDRKQVWELDLGYLDPVEEISGVQARLRNLGFPIDEINGELDERTQRALKLFQAESQIPITGEIDEATATQLAARHDTQEAEQ